jgi:hypothetical protein
MGRKLAARIQKLFRGARYIPEGADTSDEHWDDLPYAGAEPAPAARVAMASGVGQELGADPVVDREWQQILTWAHGTGPAEPDASTDDEIEEWMVALARAKSAFVSAATDDEAQWAECLARAKLVSAAVSPPVIDEEAEWAATLARAKAQAEAPRPQPALDARLSDEDAEWRTMIERAKARPAVRAELNDLSRLMDRMRAGSKSRAAGPFRPLQAVKAG